ncbi:glycosyltransferase family 2 protein [Paractinoplanes rishiriensis]|uniref:Glycosyltransferase 2-like domain-containing protein n=1 Tax=Paractinoplanes rishiriensis TaxID=1050105 RepID=A0A919MWR8_9ACTN|nr:glycosyltransferase [Actinoplanes rishiriensis]GIE97749.1 hypothetical protein Ari01nite_52140 [Actinoplanes rishiriensis]
MIPVTSPDRMPVTIPVTVVVPTVGRASLTRLLDVLETAPGDEILVVDDRPERDRPLPIPPRFTVLPGTGRGPAAARNTGWRAARRDWVVFLDDDVLPEPGWRAALEADLAGLPDDVGGVQGDLHVPLPADRRPTDWERVTAGLTDGAWITADMAFRRLALAHCGGFDERLPRAFREDAELAHRVHRAGWRLHRGDRRTVHPVRAESPWVSLRNQRGNADDALLRRLYGRYWRLMLDIPAGRRHRHAAVTAAGLLALCAAAAGHRSAARAASRRSVTGAAGHRSAAEAAGHRSAAGAAGRRWAAGAAVWRSVAAVAGAAWLAGTAEFATARIAPGPRDPREVATMLVTSAAIPPLAVAHWLRGWRRWRGARSIPVPPVATRPGFSPAPPAPGADSTVAVR